MIGITVDGIGVAYDFTDDAEIGITVDGIGVALTVAVDEYVAQIIMII